MAKISREDVLKLASLSKIKLKDEEVDQFVEELGAIVGYVEQINSVQLDDLEPTDQVTGLRNVTRPDIVVDYQASQNDLLKNLPDRDGDYIKVKRVLQ